MKTLSFKRYIALAALVLAIALPAHAERIKDLAQVGGVRGNALVGKVGGWFETMKITDFWLMHAGFAATAGAVFILFKLLLAPRLMGGEVEGLAS